MLTRIFLTRILKILKIITPLRGYTHPCMPYCGCMHFSITT